MSGRYEVWRDRISGRYAVVSPADEVIGWFVNRAMAAEAARRLNGEER